MTLALLLLACATSEPTPPAPNLFEAPPAEEAAPPGTEPAERADRPPLIKSVVLSPTAPLPADEITVDVKVIDPEGGKIDVDYQWVINESVRYDITTASLSAASLKRGDKVAVEVTASDGPNQVTGRSKPVTVQNTPPEITADVTKMSQLDGFKVTAKDRDGDALSWRLEGAPKGLSVDVVGKLSYKGAEDEPGGDYSPVVVVDDGHGGFAKVSFGVNIAPGRKAGKEKRGGT